MSHLVLVPLDGSEFSESALPVALTITRRRNAQLEIVTVQENPPMLAHDLLQLPSHGWFEQYIEEIAERVHAEAGFTVRATVLKGSPAEAIQNHAAARGVDLVVMATHGRGPMSRFWLGSTADGLIRRSTIPILLLRPCEEAPGTQPDFDPRRVLVPLDGSDESEAILTHALALAGNGETEFDLLRVYPYPKEIASSYLPHTVQVNADLFESGRTAAAQYVEEKAATLIERGIPATGHVVTDREPAEGILHFAEQRGADLIAMCTHGRGGVSRFVLGSVTDKVIRGAQIPTLVFHPHDA
ncbi:MAG: universal stress protein [Gemmatimonadetes bacterium]|nr:universal stress protein [Gemmatimonadota bacterium]